ncbi:MAG: HAD-IC family P-type ATPase, partial [Candidatus Dormibacteraeota bacterium]|nr:HAD-IC family P-type ATPase [Candidatus Dormibacteraeota bacterium]
MTTVQHETAAGETAHDPLPARDEGRARPAMPMTAHEHDAHQPAGYAVLPQDGQARSAARPPAAGQSDAATDDAPGDHAAMHHDGAMAGMDHAQMAGMDHAQRQPGGMSHDMSDPAMAQAMESDIRTRFFVALLLTIPVILYSPLGQGLVHITLPTPIPVNWLLLLLTTPIVFWAGWLFVGGAFRALQARTLDMSVLIATGVLTAYLFSAYLTVTGGPDTFFDAAAMLVTFVLFGHWMEMRSRKGTTESLRALFDLVPPQATVIRGGQEVQVNTADVVVGDLIRIRPGDKVPVDGVVTAGATNINEALVTGESLPVAKQPGDAVIGGAINQAGSIVMRATRVGAD